MRERYEAVFLFEGVCFFLVVENIYWEMFCVYKFISLLCGNNLIMAEKIRDTEPVQVNKKIKAKVAKKVAGTKVTIGKFYDEAAEEKLKQKSN